jgi:prepilin signal peptidase PulO-like enzyme (type II secretory pathway)
MDQLIIPLVGFGFVLGLAVGSFLNVVILRGIEKQSFRGRSQCLSCKKTLSWYELIPVVSFLIQKGRCRTCGAVLSFQYPLVELGTGILYVTAAYYVLGREASKYMESLSPSTVASLLLVLVAIAAALVIIVVDLRSQIIPNGAALTLFITGILFTVIRLFQTNSGTEVVLDLIWNIGAAGIIALFLAALWFFSRGTWMGFGDVKLIFATSLIVGFPASVAALLFAFWLGGAFGIVFLLAQRLNLHSRMPFGPFIIVGAVLAYFFTDYILTLVIVI